MFNVGDKVILRKPSLEVESYSWWLPSMDSLDGLIVTIKAIDSYDNTVRFYEGDMVRADFWYDIEWLEPYSEEILAEVDINVLF